MLLSEILDCKQLHDDIENNFIRIAYNRTEPNLAIFCYTAKTQYARHWNNATRNARGLCVRAASNWEHGYVPTVEELEVCEIVSRGIPKFFTIDTFNESADVFTVRLEDDDENVKETDVSIVDAHAPTIAAVKYDGAMCVGYVTTNGTLRVHTKGSFDSDEARIANEWLKKNTDTRQLAEWVKSFPRQVSPIFEIITPRVPHIINYHGAETLILLGFTDNKTGAWEPYDETNEKHAEWKYDVADRIANITTLGDALALNEPDIGGEGLVLTVYGNVDGKTAQRLFKLKWESYLKMQRISMVPSDTIKCLARYCLINDIDNETDMKNCDVKHMLGFDNIAINPASLQHTLSVAIQSVMVIVNDCKDEYETCIAKATQLIQDASNVYTQHVLNNVDPVDRAFAFAQKRIMFGPDVKQRICEQIAESVVNDHNVSRF